MERVFLPKDEMILLEPFFCEMWILKKGMLTLITGKERKNRIDLGQLFLLPPGDTCSLISEQNTQCIRFFLPDCLVLCERFFFPDLIKEKSFFKTSFNPVEMVPLLWEYTQHLDKLFEECPLTVSFLRIKILEFFYLLRCSYSKREIAGLFFSILRKEDYFAQFIEENYPRIKTVREMAREANMSLRSFENKFNLVFGTSPGRWILQRKMQTVYREIVTSHIPLTMIADKCGFASLSHMSDFCKKHLGKSPSQIRKEGYL